MDNLKQHFVMNLRMKALVFFICFGLVTSEAPNYEDLIESLMTTDMIPDNGPEMDTVYIPGTPGGKWSEDEINVTRKRILQMIHPVWPIKQIMGVASTKLGKVGNNINGEVTENVLLRLVFHDCIPYTDGTGGCDGCLNYKGIYVETPSNTDKPKRYTWPAANLTSNKGLDRIVEKLELIYTTVDWPFKEANLEVSLYQSGKSRADLWQLAGLVALEQTLERANRACDLDYHARQQVTLLEGRDKCEIKLNKPLKFQTGRVDCISDDPEGRAHVTTKEEHHPKVYGDAKHVLDFGKNQFNMDPEHWIAVAIGIHGVVHSAQSVKYTWVGSGYLNNMLFKMIANHKKYNFGKGGDLAFTSGDAKVPIVNYALGDQDGNPLNMTAWRVSCFFLWDTPEGGPCVLRPVQSEDYENPAAGKVTKSSCVVGVDEAGNCKFSKTCKGKNAYCDENNVVYGGPTEDPSWTKGWSNQFGFPWEVGMYWKFHVGGVGQRPMGCPGIDDEFGTYSDPKWPFVVREDIPIIGSYSMKCEEKAETAHIIDAFASDNERFAETFLEGWQEMISNGYSKGELVDGPQNAWVGYHSLEQQGINIEDFEKYIAENAPLTFTDPKADPWICGHRGHATTSCGYRFSRYFELGENEKAKVFFNKNGQVL